MADTFLPDGDDHLSDEFGQELARMNERVRAAFDAQPTLREIEAHWPEILERMQIAFGIDADDSARAGT